MNITFKKYNEKGGWEEFTPDWFNRYEWVTTIHMTKDTVVTYLREK